MLKSEVQFTHHPPRLPTDLFNKWFGLRLYTLQGVKVSQGLVNYDGKVADWCTVSSITIDVGLILTHDHELWVVTERIRLQIQAAESFPL